MNMNGAYCGHPCISCKTISSNYHGTDGVIVCPPGQVCQAAAWSHRRQSLVVRVLDPPCSDNSPNPRTIALKKNPALLTPWGHIPVVGSLLVAGVEARSQLLSDTANTEQPDGVAAEHRLDVILR